MRKRSLDEVDADQQHAKRRRIEAPEKVKLFAEKRFYTALNEALNKEQAVEIVDVDSLVFANIKVDSLRGWELLCEAIAANQSIKNIFFYGPCQHLTADALQSIFDTLPMNNYIKTVRLSWNLPGIQSEWWSNLVRLTKSIEDLTIPADSLTAGACKSLSEALIVNNSIHKLIMHNNSEVGAKGCLWISEALKVNKTLAHLYLGSCGVDDEGCTYLSEALKVNQFLSSLSLSSNKFTNTGLASLCNALKINTTIEILCLDDNNIQSEGCKLLTDLLTTNTTLKSLSLRSNNFTDEDCHYLAEIIKVTKVLSSLDIGLNKYCEQGLDIIGDALEVNRSLTEVNCDNKIIKRSSSRMQRIYRLANNNRENLKRDMIERMVVAFTSIAKRPESYQLFPKEIWIAIFARITYPGLESFGDIASKIFNDVTAK